MAFALALTSDTTMDRLAVSMTSRSAGGAAFPAAPGPALGETLLAASFAKGSGCAPGSCRAGAPAAGGASKTFGGPLGEGAWMAAAAQADEIKSTMRAIPTSKRF